jgi:hypothetical protein
LVSFKFVSFSVSEKQLMWAVLTIEYVLLCAHLFEVVGSFQHAFWVCKSRFAYQSKMLSV